MINRKTIYEIIKHSKDSVASQVYDWFMLTMIVVSIIPLAFRVDYLLFNIFDKIAVSVFIIDYILRWLTADYQLQKKIGGNLSFYILSLHLQLLTYYRYYHPS